MSRSPRHSRGLALALLAAALWVPCAGAIAATHPCCPGMAGMGDMGASAPCHDSQPAPCEALAETSCCDVVPAGAGPTAQRECSQPTPFSGARALHAAPASALELCAAAHAAPWAAGASPLRLSVVLRN